MNDTQSKKEQFINPQKSKLPKIIATVLVVVIAIVSLLFYMNRSNDEKVVYFGEPVADSRSYLGKVISMTNVDTVIENGSIKISLDEVDKNNIVFFEAENSEKEIVPLMAYITPTGRLFVGSSMCEPCKGRKFSLAGETLLCDTCKTTYNVETHEFLSGAKVCGEYPPVNMNPIVENGVIIFDEEEVLNWKIRI